jgi:hypothetical protein
MERQSDCRSDFCLCLCVLCALCGFLTSIFRDADLQPVENRKTYWDPSEILLYPLWIFACFALRGSFRFEARRNLRG